MRLTIDKIVDLSGQPISIIIIGIGDDDSNFKNMDILDADEEDGKVKLFHSNGSVSKRDIV